MIDFIALQGKSEANLFAITSSEGKNNCYLHVIEGNNHHVMVLDCEDMVIFAREILKRFGDV